MSTMYLHMVYFKNWIVSLITYGITFCEILAILFYFYGERLVNQDPLTATLDFFYFIGIFFWIVSCSVFSVRSYEYSERRGYYDKKLQEDEIKEWKRLMEDLPEPVLFVDKGKINFCNKAAKVLIGSDISPRNINSSLVSEEIANIIQKKTKMPLDEIIKQNALSNESEFVYKKANYKHNLLIKCVESASPDGITEYIFKDVTSIKALERAKAKEQCFDVLLATASHDIKTPLNIMLGVFDCIKENLENDFARDQMKVAINCGQRMMHYLDGLGLIRQVNLGTLSIKKRIYNPRSIILNIIQMLEYSAFMKKIALNISINGGIPENICSDRKMYTLIIQNLLENSLKYTFVGCVEVSLSYDKENFLLKTGISDTGIGMSKEQLTNAGLLFKNTSKRCSLNPQGLGLGLYLAKTLSAKLDGSIDIQSEPGKGTKISFTVRNYPISEAIPEARSCYESSSIGLSSNQSLIHLAEEYQCECPKILLVDDEPLNLMVLGNYLNSINIRYEKAENGQIALDKLNSYFENIQCKCKGYKLIFMDINMPVLDGVQATIKIKQMILKKKIPQCFVVAVTAAAGLDDPAIYVKYIEQGFSELSIFLLKINIVSKPVLKVDFLHCLSKYIQ